MERSKKKGIRIEGYVIHDSWYGEMKFSKFELLRLQKKISIALMEGPKIIY